MSRQLRHLAAVVATLLVATACQSSTSPSPPSAATQQPGSSVVPSFGTPASGSTSPGPSAPPTSAPSTAPSWAAAGSTIAWRRDPHAVALSNGQVLVVGSVEPSDGSEIQTTAELWDQATNTWTATAGLPKGRTEFVAVPIGNNRVLVAGGLSPAPQSYSSAYIYDGSPGKGTWTKTGLMTVARTAPSAAVLPDGRVLVAGGYFYSPQAGSSDREPTAELASFRVASGTGSSGADGRLFDVDPGIGGAALATAELFDPETGTWSPTGSMHYARSDASITTLADGRVLVFGSASSIGSGYRITVDDHAFTTAEIYDPATGRFSLAGSLPKIDRAALQKQGKKGANPMPTDDGEIGNGPLVALQDGGAVMIAATGYWKHEADMTRSFRFDKSTVTWSEIGKTYVFVGEPTEVPLWTPGVPALVGASVAGLHDGRVLVAGGEGPNQYGDTGYNSTPSSAAAVLYDPVTNTWSTGPAMPEPRSGGASVVLSDGSVLLVNGTHDTTDDQTQLFSAVRFVP